MSKSTIKISRCFLLRFLENINTFDLCPEELVGRYVILSLGVTHGPNLIAGARADISRGNEIGELAVLLGELGLTLNSSQVRKTSGLADVRALFKSYHLRGLRGDTQDGLVGWFDGRYPLILRHDIPTPAEMLALQCRGKRYVTWLNRPEQQCLAYGRHLHAGAFLLHDFEHASKFFADETLHRGQVRFFQALAAILPTLARWEREPRFTRDLNYLKSDMNSHPVHLLKYLKAIILDAEVRLTGNRNPPLNDWWVATAEAWGLNTREVRSLLAINQPEVETEDDQVTVRDFFSAPPSNSLAVPPGHEA